MATQRFDLVVLGTGSAASAVAYPCRSAGWTVAIVDSRPFGGTCALRGCDPKKVLVGAAELIDWDARMDGKGVRGGLLGIDWGELMRFKRTFTDPVSAKREEEYAKAGIIPFHGHARFVGPKTVQVGPDRLEGRYLVVATGARPARLSIPGEEHLTMSDQSWSWTSCRHVSCSWRWLYRLRVRARRRPGRRGGDGLAPRPPALRAL